MKCQICLGEHREEFECDESLDDEVTIERMNRQINILKTQLKDERARAQKLADVVDRCMTCFCGPTTKCSRCEALAEYQAQDGNDG